MSITYEQLFEILRKEKNHDDLQKLDEKFFEQVASYLMEKNNALNKPRLDDFSAENEQNAIRTQLQNIKKILKNIFNRRERKIIEMAINKAKTSSNIVDTSSLLPEESSFFESQIQAISGFRKEFLDSMLSGSKKAPEAPKQASEELEKPQDLNTAPEDSQDNDLKKIQITENVAKFVGTDLEVYGPYSTNDTIDLQSEIANMLISTNKAKEIEQ